MSKKSAREELRAQRAREAAAAKRRENMMRIGIAVVVAVVIVAIAGVVQWQRSQVDTDAAFPAGVVQPYTATSKSNPAPVQTKAGGVGSGVGVGKANAPVVVEMFEDFACPHCKEFENDAEQTLNQQVDAGKARVIYYPLTLTEFGRPTQLAANAFACAANDGKAREMHDALYANYSQTWTNAQLVDLGKSIGLNSGTFRSCVNGDSFSSWVQSIGETGNKRGVQGTPTIFVNGKQLDPQDTSATGLKLAIDSAAAQNNKS
ncbi:DsbA family protein [Actinopolymorpha pittospori]|uniref:Protein-disulfide isomerase n=1 Tax=Actinopolymorpha pittospori TaxID=648752 RepID=A0A927N245_9ACTN|nr:thioredoxin domain-containing protein [Actinopolymorpha pittospori]MBE1610749.1 protein-disulfide isomerase [Actinopolymorpha pittospori]